MLKLKKAFLENLQIKEEKQSSEKGRATNRTIYAQLKVFFSGGENAFSGISQVQLFMSQQACSLVNLLVEKKKLVVLFVRQSVNDSCLNLTSFTFTWSMLLRV